MKDDKIYVSYILECVSRIEQYAGNDRDIFMLIITDLGRLNQKAFP